MISLDYPQALRVNHYVDRFQTHLLDILIAVLKHNHICMVYQEMGPHDYPNKTIFFC